MQGRKVYQEKLFVNFQLSDHVPEDNLYRRILGLIDFDYLYKLTAPYYGKEGRKSIDPVVFMKLMLVGYLENINSDRRIIEVCRLRMDILFFLGYGLGETLPWHSTLSRTRQLYNQEVFTCMFQQVLSLCMDKGMLSGRRQAVDGFYIKANASLDNMMRRDILEDAHRYAGELEANAEEFSPRTVEMPRPRYTPVPMGRPCNDTHCNPRDPDAKMSIKPGKAMSLNYLGEVSVDTSSHVITHIQAFTADKRDSQCLGEMVARTRTNLLEGGLDIAEVLADKGFSGGQALRDIQEMGITGYIPNRPQFRAEREGFEYDQAGDCFICAGNKKLPYACATGCNALRYASKKADCHGCALQGGCSAYKPTEGRAVINVSRDREYYIQMYGRMQTKKAARMMKLRQSTVEPVIGSLVSFFGMKKVNTIGLAQANKCITLAGATYNLKKLTKYIGTKKRKAMALIRNRVDGRFITLSGILSVKNNPPINIGC